MGIFLIVGIVSFNLRQIKLKNKISIFGNQNQIVVTSNFHFNYLAYGPQLKNKVFNMELKCKVEDTKCITNWISRVKHSGSKWLIFSIRKKIDKNCVKTIPFKLSHSQQLIVCQESQSKIFKYLISKYPYTYFYPDSYIIKTVDLPN